MRAKSGNTGVGGGWQGIRSQSGKYKAENKRRATSAAKKTAAKTNPRGNAGRSTKKK